MEAWKKCAETASVKEQELNALIRTCTLEALGELESVTKERIRQRTFHAISYFRRNSQTHTALKRWFSKKEPDLLARFQKARRNGQRNYTSPFSGEEAGLLRVIVPSFNEWARSHQICPATGHGIATKNEGDLIRAAVGEEITTIHDLALKTGAKESVIAGMAICTNGYVRRLPLNTKEVKLLSLTDPWRDQYIVTRKEILEKNPHVSSNSLDDLLHYGTGVAWGAGPYVVIPPRHYIQAPIPLPQKRQPKSGMRVSEKALRVLSKKTFWRNNPALDAIKSECGVGVTYWISHVPEVTRIAPGLISSKQNLTQKEWGEIYEEMLTTNDLSSYLLAKESGSRLANFPAWTPTLEYKWAEWLKSKSGKTIENLEIRLSRIAKPATWPIPEKKKEEWIDQYNWLSEQVANPPHYKTHIEVSQKDYANLAALCLATGGASVFDIGILRGRKASANTQILDYLSTGKDPWFDKKLGVEWRPRRMVRTNKKQLLEMLEAYSQERQSTQNKRKRNK